MDFKSGKTRLSKKVINCMRYKRSLTQILHIVNLSHVFIWEGAHFYIAFRLTTWLSGEIIIVDTRIDVLS